MGCGVSDLAEPLVQSVTDELVKLDKNGFNIASGFAPMAIKKLKRLAAETISNNLLVKNWDVSRTVAKTGAEGVHEPPDGEAIDGLLGITKKEVIAKLRKGLSSDNPFCDETYPADDCSLYFSINKRNKEPLTSKIFWLRPKDMTSEPKLIIDDVTKKDVLQGRIGDCWFISAVAAIATRSNLMRKVIPKGQSLYGANYDGLIMFHFWRFGHWITVHVDDRLPIKDGNLINSHCKNSKEFWVPLLEKAYAKLHGSYEALDGGQSTDALVDLTGGLAECYSLHGTVIESYRKMRRAHSNGSFITCSRKGDWTNTNVADENGLVSGHSYTVTHVTTVPTQTGKYVNLVRIRNPWGNSSEWKGSWSDSSITWNQVDETVKKNLEVEDCPDGEFWMSFKDFCTEFYEINICTLAPEVDEEGAAVDKNRMKIIKSAWELGKNCGGCRNNLQKFSQNPQFLLTISEEETYNEDEDVDLSGRRNVLISLMQDHRRSRKKFGTKYAHIGFVIYKASDDEFDRRLPTEYFLIHTDLGTSGDHINHREVTGRFHFVPGKYVIIPSTYQPDCSRPFLLRVYCDQRFIVRELKEEPSALNLTRK